MKKNKVYILSCLIILGTIFIPNISSAVLQADHFVEKHSDWSCSDWTSDYLLKAIREMESFGGTMGLTEEINDDLTTNGQKNNIDIHMQKNTEYGAMAILSASSYGKNVSSTNNSSTGNATGIIFNNQYELVSAQNSDLDFTQGYNNFVKVYGSIAKRYFDQYKKDAQKNEFIAKKGDASQETKNWNGAEFNINDRYSLILNLGRGGNGNLFRYNSYVDRWGGGDGRLYIAGAPTRAIVVSGQDF